MVCCGWLLPCVYSGPCGWRCPVELLTVQEIARMLKVTPITVRRHIAAGRLPAVKVGRAVRVRREAVDEFVTPVQGAGQAASALPLGTPTSEDDPLWNIVGTSDSGPDGPPGVAGATDSPRAEAVADLFVEEGGAPAEHSLLRIARIGEQGEDAGDPLTNVASDKYAYLAEAYSPRAE